MDSKELLKNRPLSDNFKILGKEYDYIFQALAYMGNASHQMSWANTILEFTKEVPNELKQEMLCVNQTIHELQEKLRNINLI